MTSEMFARLEAIFAWRHRLRKNGYLPLSILTRSKIPFPATGYQDRARQGECLRFFPVPHAMNTGILCDRLRVLDLDVDDISLAALLRALVIDMFGSNPPTRFRCDSPRKLMPYRAEKGVPPTISIRGNKGGVQILGRDTQFLAYGVHPSGAEL
jgi:hypothetical protein